MPLTSENDSQSLDVTVGEETISPKRKIEQVDTAIDSELEKTSEKTKVFKSDVEATESTPPKAEVAVSSLKENVEVVNESLSNSEVKGVIPASNGSADKVENKPSNGDVGKTDSKDLNSTTDKVNGASEPLKPMFSFGSTLKDPKYSWLDNFGKNPLGSNVPSLKPQKNDTASMFQGFKASANTSLTDKDAKDVDFDALLTTAKDTEQPKPEPTAPKLQLVDEVISTGEEDEETLFEATGKLHVLGKDMKWVERGVGLLKINGLRSNVLNRRIIMRLESVHKVVLNVKVVPDLKPTAEGKFVRFSAFETEGSPSSFTFRTSSADIAEWMVEEMTRQ